MKNLANLSLAFSTLSALRDKLRELDGLPDYDTAGRAEVERVLGEIISDQPVCEMLEGELKALREMLPANFADRPADAKAAREAVTVLTLAFGAPATDGKSTINEGTES